MTTRVVLLALREHNCNLNSLVASPMRSIVLAPVMKMVLSSLSSLS